jgi:hypothetical protein
MAILSQGGIFYTENIMKFLYRNSIDYKFYIHSEATEYICKFIDTGIEENDDIQ